MIVAEPYYFTWAMKPIARKCKTMAHLCIREWYKGVIIAPKAINKFKEVKTSRLIQMVKSHALLLVVV
jgi:hypothetical protein